MERDRELRRSFFRRLAFCFYSGASLGAAVTERLERLAREETGRGLLMVTGYGSTETAPACVASTCETAAPGVVGLPLPGIALKLVPANGKREARVKGPTIMPGYWRDPEATGTAFDEEGYYRLGDALRFVDEARPESGLAYDGRLAEDFKLATGTWVNAGALRLAALRALAPLAKDIVLAGHDRDEIGALVFPDFEACAELSRPPKSRDGDEATIAADAKVLAAFAASLARFAATATGSSTRITRLVILPQPPSIDVGEFTDKGSINQRAVLTRRAALVEDLYRDPPPPHVIVVPGAG
jgi:feruloyl-CoA synthase